MTFEALESRRLLTALYRVNAGGGSIAGDPSWSADLPTAPSSFLASGSSGQQIFGTGNGILLTHPSVPAGTPAALFQTERWDHASGAEMRWQFPLTPGQYEVRLYFAEIYSGAQQLGGRVFDVAIEDQLVLDNYDVYAKVGANKGVVESIVVQSDSLLDIEFRHQKENPAIKALEILALDQAEVENAAPVIDLPVQFTMSAGEQANLPFSVRDTDGDNVFVTAANLPTFVNLVDLGQGQARLEFAPSSNHVGTHTITVQFGDDGQPPHQNQRSLQLVVRQPGTPSDLLYRINVGGPQIAGDPAWTADSSTSATAYRNAGSQLYTTGAQVSTAHPSIPAGTPAAVFQSERWDPAGGSEMQWQFPVTPGEYDVRLYFAEIYGGAQSPGKRVFDVSIENQLVLDNYDVFADVGGYQGVVKTFRVTADASLNLLLQHVKENPALKGIEILRGKNSSPPQSPSQDPPQTTPPTNHAPVWNSASTVTVQAGNQQQLTVRAQDPDQDGLQLQILEAPGFVTLQDQADGTAIVTIHPQIAHVGSHTVRLEARDTASVPLSSLLTFRIDVTAPPLDGKILYRVNAGGGALAGAPGWNSDAASAAWHNGLSSSSATAGTTAAIKMDHPSLPTGTPAAMLQTERWDSSAGSQMQWAFPVEPGQYEVRLYFAETYGGTQKHGARVFDVRIEGQLVLSRLDVFAEAGAHRGLMKSALVDADHLLNIDFVHIVENPSIKGIEIIQRNDPNTAPQLAPIAGIQVPAGQVREVPLNASDAEGDTLQFAAVAFPSFVTLVNPLNGQPRLRIAPELLNVGVHSVTIGVSDGKRTAEQQFTVDVTASGNVVHRVNAGGPAISGGPAWQPDVVAIRPQPEVGQIRQIGSQLEMFVDNYLIDTLTGARLEMNPPQLAASLPGQHTPGAYTSVLFDGQTYHRYYRGHLSGVNPSVPPYPDGTNKEVYRYETSQDGLHWTQPELNLFNVNVDGPNNVILAGQAPSQHNFTPFLDTRPGVDPNHRFKALAGLSHVGAGPAGVAGLRAYSSPDGIHWNLMQSAPVITLANLPGDGYAFDSANVSFWSAAEQKYVVYFRTWTGGGPGHPSSLRTFTRAESSDFIQWQKFTDINVNLPGEHLYANAVHPYYRAPHLYTAMPTQFLPSSVHNTRILFMTSRDGFQFDRPFGQQDFISGLPGNRQNYAAPLIVPTGPDELSIYGQSGQRYTLRMDGFSSIDTTGTAGEMRTRPLIFSGDLLKLNYQTIGSIRVELQDEFGNVLPGYSLADSDPLQGDTIDGTVTWNGQSDVSVLSGRPVRVRFVMVDADLFAMQFVADPAAGQTAHLNLGQHLATQRGEQFTMPLQMTVRSDTRLESLTSYVRFDASRFQIEEVVRGPLPAGVQLDYGIDAVQGVLRISLQTPSPVTLPAGTLTLAQLRIRTATNATAGISMFDLIPEWQGQSTELNLGQLPLLPALKVGPNVGDTTVFVEVSYFNHSTSGSQAATTPTAVHMNHPSLPPGTPATLFQTERWDPAGGDELQWNLAVDPGVYEVRLYFAETQVDAQYNGARVFHVDIEGRRAFDHLDVYANAGSRTGLMRSFITHSDAVMDIDFTRVKGNPSVRGLEIIRLQEQPSAEGEASGWRHTDVTGDGAVTLRDVLVIINVMNSGATIDYPNPYGFDINGDGVISARDVLVVMNDMGK